MLSGSVNTYSFEFCKASYYLGSSTGACITLYLAVYFAVTLPLQKRRS